MGTRELCARAARAAGGALLAALALAGCGGGGSGSPAPEAAAQPAAGTPVVAQPPSGDIAALVARTAAAAAASAKASTAPLRAAGAGNPLSNGDFEAGMTGWADWGNAQAIDGAGASGTGRALRVGTAAGGAGHEVGGIVAGSNYRVTAQVKVSAASEAVFIGINILDQWNATIAQQAVSVSSTAFSLATVDVSAPANAAKAVVFVWKNDGAGYAFVDDVVLAAPGGGGVAPAGTGASLVSNGGFESSLAGWTNWNNAAAVAGQASSGAAALRVGTGAGGVGQDVAAVVAGKGYRLSGQVKVSVASEVAYLGVSFFDAWGTKLLEQNVPASATSFTGVTLDAVAPAGASKAQVYVWKNAGSGFAFVDDVALAPIEGAAAAPPPSAPAPSPVDVGVIPVAAWPTTLLQVGSSNDAYWVEDGVWAAWGLTRGGYAGTSGLNYEQYTGVSPKLGPNGEVAFRMAWKWPLCCNEIKSFPSIVSGRKPGWYNPWITPGGYDVRLPDGATSQVYPTGATPGTFFPLQLPIASLKTSFNYRHMTTPTGRGHLAYDVFLQSQPTQLTGFGATITHEIMVPLDNWGGYGVYPTRNPAWYDHDVTIDGLLFHVYAAKDGDGALRPTFNGGWKFIVFQPDKPIPPGTLDLAKFVNYVTTRKDAFGTPWAWGNEYAVSVELGVEPHEGVGDIQVSNFRVWR